MRNKITAATGAALLAGALLLSGTGVAQAAPSAAAYPMWHHHHHAHKVQVKVRGGAYVWTRPYRHARVVAHLGLGVVVVLAGPTLWVHGSLWLKIRDGGWICARDVAPVRS